MADDGRLFREYMGLQRKRDGDGLSVAELQRWNALKAQLNQRFHPGRSPRPRQGPDLRTSVRVPTRLQVGFASPEEAGTRLMTNLSRGGLFIATDHPLPIGTPLALRIRIEEPPQEIEVKGEVVSQNLAPDLMTEERGMGVRFSRVSEQDQKILDDLYEGTLQRALASENS